MSNHKLSQAVEVSACLEVKCLEMERSGTPLLISSQFTMEFLFVCYFWLEVIST